MGEGGWAKPEECIMCGIVCQAFFVGGGWRGGVGAFREAGEFLGAVCGLLDGVFVNAL